MQNIRAKIVGTKPYAEGSEAVRITAAPLININGHVEFDIANPIEAIILPMPWNRLGETASYAASQVDKVGLMIFDKTGNPTGEVPPEVAAVEPILEFFLVGR